MTYRIYMPNGNHVRIKADGSYPPTEHLIFMKKAEEDDSAPVEVAIFQRQQWTFFCEEAAFEGLFTAPAETTP